VDAGGVTGPGAGQAADAAALPAAERLDEIPGLAGRPPRRRSPRPASIRAASPPRRHWSPGPGSPRPRGSPAPARAAGRRDTATPTPSGSRSWPPTPPRTPARSSASGSAAWLPAPAAAGGRRPAAPWAARSWSSCGTR
jgi:hypothetical protein